jgi:single-strand DNA-binding protein
MLRVSLLGNLGADPEVRYTAKGTQIVSFRVAVNQFRFGPDGERQENTEWFRIRVSGRQAEFAQRLGKGSKVLVFGRLDISHFQAKDGEQRTGFDVWADDVQSMSMQPRPMAGDAEAAETDSDTLEPALSGVSSLNGGGSATSSAANGSGRGRSAPRGGSQSASANGSSEELEDLPF